MNEQDLFQLQTQNTLKDHEERLRIIEKDTTELKYKLTDIQKSQSDIKLMINENQNSFTDKLTDTITQLLSQTVSTDNQIKLTDRKEFWGMLTALVGIGSAVITYMCK